MTQQGYFITIEGGEATGKTTQIQKLKNHFVKNDSYYFTREPGGTIFAEDMREYIVTGDKDKMLPISELLLLNAARYDHLQKLIIPKLNQGVNVVCDRFLDSTIAYQSSARGVPQKLVYDMHKLVNGNFTPNLTIVLDLDSVVARQRVLDRDKDSDERFEKFPLEFHQTIRNSFLSAADRNDRNIKVIDATQSPALIFDQIIASIDMLGAS